MPLKDTCTSAMLSRPQAYLLQNSVTHARLLPTEAAHAFTYPTLALLVSLKALERGKLDLARGWVFGYGGRWCRMTGLRPKPYLDERKGSIMTKLNDILKARGCTEVEDAWMMTMPSFLGVEGINPLTVYFCYDSAASFRFTVLEVRLIPSEYSKFIIMEVKIHNTFGESHVHVLQIGKDEDEVPSRGYDHEWTFRREFHVSPFNDRSGFYTVSIKSPTHSPMESPSVPERPPRPAVRVHLYTDANGEKGRLKLTALMRPTGATPLTTRSLMWGVAQAPFGWFLTFPRILFVAWKLHYQKRLDVFIRPEPQPVPSGGVKWLSEGFLEGFARRRLEAHLVRRAQETGIQITLQPVDPSVSRHTFAPGGSSEKKLVVSYLAPRFFTIVFLSPSAEHALLLGCDTERLFTVSDRDLFRVVFSGKPHDNERLQRLRLRDIPPELDLHIPRSHYLDNDHSRVVTALAICTFFFLEWLERGIFGLARARVVKGLEPWEQWGRAAGVYRGGSYNAHPGGSLGSVRAD